MNHTPLATSRRNLFCLGAVSLLSSACEAIGLKATVVTQTNINGQTKTRVREVKNWGEFEKAMGEVATDFSDVAKAVGKATADLVQKLVDVPPPGQVELGHLSPALQAYEGDVRYDYLKVSRMAPNAPYDFRYVRLGVPSFDNFFRASAEMYATAYQLVETGRHVHLAFHGLRGDEIPNAVENGKQKILRGEVEGLLREMGKGSRPDAVEGVESLKRLWETTSELGVGLVKKVSETVQTGTALVTGAPSSLTNPKLLLHLDLIVKGLKESVAMVKDTGGILASVVA